MKVIETDNFGGEYPYERLVIGGLSDKAAGEIAAIINREKCSSNPEALYWKVEIEGYELTEGPEA